MLYLQLSFPANCYESLPFYREASHKLFSCQKFNYGKILSAILSEQYRTSLLYPCWREALRPQRFWMAGNIHAVAFIQMTHAHDALFRLHADLRLHGQCTAPKELELLPIELTTLFCDCRQNFLASSKNFANEVAGL